MTDTNPYIPSTEPQESVGNFTILSNMLTSPAKAMSQVQQNYGILFPILTMTLLTSIVMFAYMQMVDYVWYVDYLVETTAGELSKSEQGPAACSF